MTARMPKGYVGKGHETIGSDILSLLKVLPSSKVYLATLFGKDLAGRLETVRPDAWYPASWFWDAMNAAEKQLGRYTLLGTGRALFQMSHEAHVKKAIFSAKDLIHGLDQVYRRANRGKDIGGWKVLKFDPAGVAEVEKTTPYNCLLEEGILLAALSCVGAPSTITQTQCFRDGAECCVMQLKANDPSRGWVPAAGASAAR